MNSTLVEELLLDGEEVPKRRLMGSNVKQQLNHPNDGEDLSTLIGGENP